MQRVVWKNADRETRARLLARPAQREDAGLREQVAGIFEAVRQRGENAVREYALKFDGAAPAVLRIDEAAATRALGRLDAEDRAAIQRARDAISRFHEAVRPRETRVETAPGVVCRQVWRPLDCVGVYVPGGTAPLFSSLMMTALPARIAGVRRIVVATPPFLNERARDAMVAAAGLCGVEELILVGGAQAIAAMTYGAAPFSRADKIVGPGGAWVAAAKAYAASLPGGPAIDMPAGPSELMVVADRAADPEAVAADLLSQAEHDRLAQVLLVACDTRIADRTAEALSRRLETLPRAEIARAALDNARALIVDTLDEALEIANAYGPEHLSLAVENAGAAADRVSCAGAVFVGGFAAESFGDYLAGPSHVLPTDGAARAFSGLSTASFMRAMSVQEITAEAARAAANPAARLARLEGLEAHAQAALARLAPNAEESAA